MSYARVAIIGLGLLGGSIGLAVKEHLPDVATTGWDRDPDTRARAAKRGLVGTVCETGAAAVADADLLGTEALASFIFSDDNKCFKLGYIGSKRYTRLTITPSGNSGTPSGALLSAVAILGHPQIAPTANPPA